MSKVLVTGGAGFIGSHLVDRLIADRHDVVVIDNFATGKRENLNHAARLVEEDIVNFEAIAPHFKDIQAVFHLAALARIQPSIKDPCKSHQANSTGTLNVLWAAHKAGVKKFIYSGTSSVYGDQPEDHYPLKESFSVNPGSPYSVSKYSGELYCKIFTRLYGLNTIILRYFNVYGPRQIIEGAYATVIGIFLQQRKLGRPMTMVEDGEIKRRDYTHVEDVVNANLLAWQKNIRGGEIFNIGCGKNYSVKEVADLIGGPVDIVPKRPGEYMITLADITKAKSLLDWSPKNTLENTIVKLKKLYGVT